MPKTLDSKIRELMEQHPDLFPTESSVWTYIRGCLRRGFWEKSPMKHRFKQSQMEPPPEGYIGRGKKGTYCALTDEWTMTSKLEVDHKDGNKSLRCEEDVIDFLVHLLASSEDELQVVSKDAHRIKSYAEKHNMTFDQAKIEKEVIQFSKLTPEQQRAKLREHGVDEDSMSNQKKRKDVYREILGGNYED